jgi:hypothetical protein
LVAIVVECARNSTPGGDSYRLLRRARYLLHDDVSAPRFECHEIGEGSADVDPHAQGMPFHNPRFDGVPG